MAVEEGLTVVIPALDEEGGIAAVVREVRDALNAHGVAFEIIVVDDGSTDATSAIASAEGATVIRLPENRGYGAALKVGIERARHDIVAITDADGTYPAGALPQLYDTLLRGYDMVVGARLGDVAIPAARRPAKWLLQRLATYLAGRRIPDLNSGMRVMRRALPLRFEHILPAGFSFTTTITLAAVCTDALVRYESINYRPRIGQSKMRPLHAFDILFLVLRSIVYFNPLKVFVPLAAMLFGIGFCKLVYDLWVGDFSESALLGLLGALLVLAVGLLSDQISRVALRRGFGESRLG